MTTRVSALSLQTAHALSLTLPQGWTLRPALPVPPNRVALPDRSAPHPRTPSARSVKSCRTFPRCSPPRKHTAVRTWRIHAAHTCARTAPVRLPDSRPGRPCQVTPISTTSWMWIPGTTSFRNAHHADRGGSMGGHGRAFIYDSNNREPWQVCFGLGIPH